MSTSDPCPVCKCESGIAPGWDNLCDSTLTCANCAAPLEIAYEESWDPESGEESIYMDLVPRS